MTTPAIPPPDLPSVAAALASPAPPTRLPRGFFARPARVVARELLGQRLLRRLDGQVLGGLIVETEAYCDADAPDLACHGSRNGGRPTSRTAVMFGPAGHAYVYFSYGMHWLFNVVTGATGQANAVLVRALEPTAGEAGMANRRRDSAGRPLPRERWADGPAKLTRALAIDGACDGLDLCDPGSTIWIEGAGPVPDARVATGPRIGIGGVPEPWRSIPWRYWIAGHACVSARSGR